MKILHALLIILLVSLYNADKCTEKDAPTKASDCSGLEVDKAQGYVKCCYEKKRYFQQGILKEVDAHCIHKTQVEYDDIFKQEKSLKGSINAMGGVIDSLILDCASTYLYISLISLISFLI